MIRAIDKARGKVVRRFALGVVTGAALLPTLCAAAEESRIEKLVKDQGKLCFASVYDQAHLKAHPRQKVERLHVMLGKNKASTYWEDPNLRHSEESPHKHASPDAERSSTAVAVLMTLRGMSKPENVAGWCYRLDGETQRLYCGGECDRQIGKLRVDDGGRLVFEEVGPYFLIDPEDDKPNDPSRKLGADDTSFRLEQRPIEECVAEANKTNSPYANLGAPLRERLRPDAAFCYGRDYAPEHLASHPKQVTTSIRVSRNATLISADRAKNLLPDWPDGASVTVSVTTRKQGRPIALSYVCTPYADQWECAATYCKSGDKDCAPQDRENAKAAGCETGETRTVYLRRSQKDFMMLGNPNMGLPLEAYCGPEKDTVSDDKAYRLEPMPLAACDGR